MTWVDTPRSPHPESGIRRGMRSPDANPIPADTGPMTRISRPCKIGNFWTNQPLPMPSTNRPTRAAVVDTAMARPSRENKLRSYWHQGCNDEGSPHYQCILLGVGSLLGDDAQLLLHQRIQLELLVLSILIGKLPRRSCPHPGKSRQVRPIPRPVSPRVPAPPWRSLIAARPAPPASLGRRP